MKGRGDPGDGIFAPVHKARRVPKGAKHLVAVDPPAKSLTFWGGLVENTFISQKVKV